MFQYAFGLSLERVSGVETRYAIDMLEGYKLHNGLEIDRVFDLPFSVANEADLVSVLGVANSVFARRFVGKFVPSWFLRNRFIQERGPAFFSAAMTAQDRAYYQGYWQSELYFSSFREAVLSAFVFRDPDSVGSSELAFRIKSCNSVAVHVRRGDYLQGKNLGIYAGCGIEFYRRAVECMAAKVGDMRLFIFGDDPDWASVEFKGLNCDFEVVNGNSGPDSYKDMLLMSLASHNIISNSTFGWWGAWINRNVGKIVVAPSRWYRGRYAGIVDMIPSDWIKVPI